jgi:hypothetical protein
MLQNLIILIIVAAAAAFLVNHILNKKCSRCCKRNSCFKNKKKSGE